MNSESTLGRSIGCNTIAFNTLKTMALAPMPRARVMIAVMAKPGDFANCRNANLRSLNMMPLGTQGRGTWFPFSFNNG